MISFLAVKNNVIIFLFVLMAYRVLAMTSAGDPVYIVEDGYEYQNQGSSSDAIPSN
jgi:hypothetical protein